MPKKTIPTVGLLLIVLSLASCTKKGNPVVDPPADTTRKSADTTIIATYGVIERDSLSFTPGTKFGSITDAAIPEASGLASSSHYKGWFWTHNDSGNPNTIFLIDSLGITRGVFTVTGCANRDWEDIAVGPGPDAGVTYIYLGEIGDNNAVHSTSIVYRFPEPTIAIGPTKVTASIDSIDKITYVYPDGPHNAETLMLDPDTKDIYVASKGSIANLYLIQYPQRTDSTITLKKLAVLPLSTLTAGDISRSGREILMKNYSQVFYWKRAQGESILDALIRTPLQEPYTVEAQGEAICWSASDDGYWTTSEKNGNVIPGVTRYSRK